MNDAKPEGATGARGPSTPQASEQAASTDKAAASVAETLRFVRTGVASAVWLLAVLAALILATGALVIALELNPDDGVVSVLTDTADRLNALGELRTFEGGRSAEAQQSALVKTVLVNWGIAAVAYLTVGKVLDRLIRP